MYVAKKELEILNHYLFGVVEELRDEFKRLGYSSCTTEEFDTLEFLAEKIRGEVESNAG